MVWTEELIKRLITMRRQNHNRQHCAKMLGCSVSAVAAKLKFLTRKTENPSWLTSQRYVQIRIIPPEVAAARAHRNGLRHTDPTAIICGDPLPGHSALDRKTEMA